MTTRNSVPDSLLRNAIHTETLSHEPKRLPNALSSCGAASSDSSRQQAIYPKLLRLSMLASPDALPCASSEDASFKLSDYSELFLSFLKSSPAGRIRSPSGLAAARSAHADQKNRTVRMKSARSSGSSAVRAAFSLVEDPSMRRFLPPVWMWNADPVACWRIHSEAKRFKRFHPIALYVDVISTDHVVKHVCAGRDDLLTKSRMSHPGFSGRLPPVRRWSDEMNRESSRSKHAKVRQRCAARPETPLAAVRWYWAPTPDELAACREAPETLIALVVKSLTDFTPKSAALHQINDFVFDRYKDVRHFSPKLTAPAECDVWGAAIPHRTAAGDRVTWVEGLVACAVSDIMLPGKLPEVSLPHAPQQTDHKRVISIKQTRRLPRRPASVIASPAGSARELPSNDVCIEPPGAEAAPESDD